jgi:hypothetical protein
MSEHSTDIARYSASVNEAAVAAIVKYCGIALKNADSAIVAMSDKDEVATVRDGFAAKKLGLDKAAAEAGLKQVGEKMKGNNRKSRVTVYYLLAEATGTLGKLV